MLFCYGIAIAIHHVILNLERVHGEAIWIQDYLVFSFYSWFGMSGIISLYLYRDFVVPGHNDYFGFYRINGSINLFGSVFNHSPFYFNAGFLLPNQGYKLRKEIG